MLTEAVIRQLAPRARDDYVKTLASGGETFTHWEFTTQNRMVAFIATCMAETGGLTIVQENMKYTTPSRIAQVWPSRFTVASAAAYAGRPEALAEVVYGGRMGNERNGVGDGDGYRFRGRGLVQTTGRDGYAKMGRLIGMPLAEQPELLDDPEVSLKAACAECSQFHQYADRGEKGFRAYSNGVNRGNPAAKADPIGWTDRLTWYRRVAKALDVHEVDDDISELGDSGALIEGYQKRLAELRYPVGTVDGIFGARLRAAVLAFQAENSLATDGRVGPLTRAVLNKSDAKPMPLGDRVNATADDLAKAGSGTIIDARAAKGAGEAVVAVSVVKGVQEQFDILGTVQGWTTNLTTMRGVIDPAIVAAKWALSAWWIFAIVAGIIILRRTNAIEKARVAAHQLGQHLGR